MDLPLQRAAAQVAGEKDRLLCPAELDHRLVGGVGGVGLHESAQDRLGGRGARPEGGGVLDHLVVLLGDALPADRASQRGRQLGPGVWFAGRGAVELDGVDPFDPRQKVEAEQLGDAEPDLGLYVDKSSGTLISVCRTSGEAISGSLSPGLWLRGTVPVRHVGLVLAVGVQDAGHAV